MNRQKKTKYGGVKRRNGHRKTAAIVTVLLLLCVAVVAFTPYFKIKCEKERRNM